jgi:GNAT superfamily N-acetyltransferase
MALAAFQSDQQALDFLYGGPVADPQLNIAPEAPVEMELGPDRMIQAADAAFLDDLDARGEPRLPQEDEDLPPVVPAEQPQAPAPFASDEEALAFLSAGAEERRVETPRPTLEAEQTSGTGFGSDEEALAFLQGAEQRAPEIKLPAPKPATTPKPVTTPEAADGSDVTFDAKGPAFQFTGTLVMDPSSGAEQGLDGMVPVAPRGPMAATAAAGQAEPVLNRRPRLVPSAGAQIVFDQSSPERFTQGVEEAFAAGILPQSNYEKIKADEAKIFKVMDDRRKLEEKAQADPRLLAVLQGAGRGGAMTVGAVGGAKLLAAAGALTGPAAPIAVPVLGVTGAIAGGIGAGLGYDALYKTLGNHFEEYDDVMKAAELFPMHKAGGEMGMVALALPVSVAQGARGLRTAFQDGGLPQVARTAGTAAGLGAGTGVVAYPIDAAVRGQEITPGGFAAAAGVGALTGGFFLNNRMAGAKDVAAVAAKMKAGTPLTAAETKLAQAAQPAISAAIARMEAAGGVRTGALEVEVPTTSVAGLVPSVGRAAARVPYRVPARLPAGAVARAKADVPQALPAPGKTAPADVSVPRTAPVNVLPSGTTVIPMPGPAPAAAVAVPRAVSAAMAEPFNWALDTANERGINLEETETDNWNALLSEHLQIVRAAIDAGEPVSVKAFQVYDLSVPFYDLDPATGMATLNAQTLRDYEEYLGGQDADYRESMADAGGEELLAAVIDLGGLPAPKSGGNRGVWSGELKALFEEAKGAGKGKGGDNQKGVFINKLFRRDGMDLDEMAMALKAKGFRVETEADLIELLGNRLRSGREIFGMATQSMEDVPLEMRGKAPAKQPQVISEERKADDGSTVVDVRKANGKVVTRLVATMHGNRVGDRWDDGMADKKIYAKDVSSKEMPDEYKIEEITTIQGKREVTTTIRDMTPDEIAAKRAQLERRNQKLAEFGAEPEPIPEVPESLATRTAGPAVPTGGVMAGGGDAAATTPPASVSPTQRFINEAQASGLRTFAQKEPQAIELGGVRYYTFQDPASPAKVAFSSNDIVSGGTGKVYVSYESIPGQLIVQAIYTPPGDRGKGRASALLKRVLDVADRAGITLKVEPVSIGPMADEGDKFMLRKQLAAWYKRYGFKQDTPDDDTILIRPPANQVSSDPLTPPLELRAGRGGSKRTAGPAVPTSEVRSGGGTRGRWCKSGR